MSTGSELPFVVRPQAGQEIEEAAEWYNCRRSGLGADFLNAVDDCLASVLRNPESYPEARSGMRRAVLRRFPYNLIYALRPSEIVVLGCVHGRRVRGQSTFTGQEGIRVYVNGQPRGGIQSLQQVLVREITTLQYLDAATATQRFGTGNTAGAILIEVQY